MTTMTTGERKILLVQRPVQRRHWEEVALARATGLEPASAPVPRDGGQVEVSATLPASTASTVLRVCRGSEDALNAYLIAAVIALESRYRGAGRYAVAIPSPDPAMSAYLLAEATVESGTTFAALVDAVARSVARAKTHADFPVDLVAGEPPVLVRDSSAQAPHPPSLRSTSVGVRRLSDEKLLVTVSSTGRTALDVVLAHLLTVLERATAAPRTPVLTLDLLRAVDRTVIEAANATDHPFDADRSLPDLFTGPADRPDAPAVVADGFTQSFAELAEATRAVTASLLAAGAQAGDRIAVMVERGPDLIPVIDAVVGLGAAYVPIDARLPELRVEHILHDCGARVVVIDAAREQELPDGVVAVPLGVDAGADVTRTGVTLAGATGPVVHGPVRPGPEDPAYVIYTSGSTGQPKGVVVEHRSVVNRIQWMQAAYPLTADDVILQKTPISFDVSVWELFWWQLAPGRLCALAPGAERDPVRIVEAIERHGVTVMHFVPTMLAAFLRYVEDAGDAARLGSLRRVFVSGEALALDHARACRRTLPHVDLVNLYGPTEATVDVSHHRYVGNEEQIPIGRPIWNTTLHVLDPGLRPCTVDMAGELWIGGVGVAQGYLDRPDLTAERFRDDVLPGAGRLYRTGDIVCRRADGALQYLGRNDQQVKIRGVRIELGEVEAALRECPGVRDSAVVARTVDDRTALAGYVVGGDPVKVRERLARTLPDAAVPETVIALDALPLSANGKLDRAALPLTTADDETRPYDPPVGPVEEAVAAVVAEVLGLSRVGRTNRLLSLGANSIHFIFILSRLKQQGLNVSFQSLFQADDVADLARRVESGPGAGRATVALAPFELVEAGERVRLPAGLVDAYPMSYLQAGTLFQSEITRGSAQYHDIISYVVDGPFDADRFRAAVVALVARHAILRTSYDLTSFADYLQLVHEATDDVPLFVEDLRALTSGEQDEWHQRWEDVEKHHEFNWKTPGFVRIHIHRLTDDRYRYSISQHNSALDGWSINQLHLQLFGLYQQLLRGRSVDRTPWTNYLRDFVAMEREAAASEVDRDYWHAVLKDRLVTRVPRLGQTSRTGYDVEMRVVPIDRELSERIVTLAAEQGVAVKTVLLAAHLKTLGLVARQDEVLTGYEYGGRPEAEGAAQALGLFLNSVPFRVDLGDGTWTDLIDATRRAEGDFLEHRRYPMARMKHDLRTQDALFETVFNFTHFHSLKDLLTLGPDFASTMDATALAITEFPFRAEFSRHHFRDDVGLSLHFHTHEFDRQQIDDIGATYLRVLGAMTSAPDRPHRDTVADFSWEIAPSSGARGGAAGAEAIVDVAAAQGATSPRLARSDPAVTLIAAAWSRVLGIPEDEIGLDDDFFELGGNSLRAMKVALVLDGTLSIRDLMVNSRLAEAARVTVENTLPASVPSTCVVPLGQPVETPRATVVCFPYGAGHAVHFRDLGSAVQYRDGTVAVVAVELPGHDASACADDLASVETIADRVIAELGARERGSVVLWGHCIGSALALAVADRLEAAGNPPAHVFLGGKLLYTDEEMRESIDYVASMSYEDIVGWLQDESRFSSVDELGPDYAEILVRTFRHDSVSANEYLIARSRPGRRIAVPTTCVLAGDDPITSGGEGRAGNWNRLCADVSVHVLQAGGGHYFVSTRPDEVADLLVGALEVAEVEIP